MTPLPPMSVMPAPKFGVGQYVRLAGKDVDIRVSAFYRLEVWYLYTSDVFPGFFIREDLLTDANAYHAAQAAAKQATAN